MIAIPARQGSTAVLVPRQLASGEGQWQALHLSVRRTGVAGKPSRRQAVPLATPFVAAAAAFVVGRISASRRRGAKPAPAEEHDPWLDSIAVSTRLAAVVHAFTANGVIEALPRPDEPFMAAAELAKRAGVKGGGKGGELERLLRFLACHEILEVDHEKGAAFRHSKRSLELLPGGKDHTFAMVHLSPAHVRPWWRVGDALQSSEKEGVPEPFRLEHGQGAFDYYSQPENAGLAQHFNTLMQELSSSGGNSGTLIAQLPIWKEVTAAGSGGELPLVVDVGGGTGHILADVLKEHPGLQGALFDRPDVITSVTPELSGELAERAALVAGDFFQAEKQLPGHASVFMMKWILHDWSDAQCRVILQGIRQAVSSSEKSDGLRPRLLLVEDVVPEEGDMSEAAQKTRRKFNDADMWVVFGGRERTLSEFSAILAEEGFAMGRVTELVGRGGGVAIEAEVLPLPQEAQAPEADLLELEKPEVAAEPLPVEESLPEEELVEEEVPAKELIAAEKSLKEEELPAPLLQDAPEEFPVPSEAEREEKPKRSQGEELKDWLMA